MRYYCSDYYKSDAVAKIYAVQCQIKKFGRFLGMLQMTLCIHLDTKDWLDDQEKEGKNADEKIKVNTNSYGHSGQECHNKKHVLLFKKK